MGQTQGGPGNGDFGGEASGDGGSNSWMKLLQGGTKGLAQGFSNMQDQNAMMRQGGPSMPVPMPQQPQVNLPMGDNPTQKIRGNNLAFYGGN